MLNKNKIKWIRSLEYKKFRKETGCFLAEGNKLVSDMLPYFECEFLLSESSWLATQGDIHVKEHVMAEEGDISRASLLRTPQNVLAVFKQPVYELDSADLKTKLTLVLDGIQDPGNFGTIIRMADWFGIENVVCSPDTVDVYNPKTMQATMGALARVRTHYANLTDFFNQFKNPDDLPFPIYGTFLEGENLYNKKLSSTGFIVMGNEGNGIGSETESFISQKIHIPNFPRDRETSESLNVAVATAIVCAEFRRQQACLGM
ncbi:MAG: RNA methyltransferase [Dysgonamonadaceae bacterium]|jgi:TrmH family RNA methyltransferase|nr:RNA methyltransferase [Dysgonamonadaceae bacterium]